MFAEIGALCIPKRAGMGTVPSSDRDAFTRVF